jgi:hypothetical protein
MTTVPVHWTRAETRTALIDLATRTAADESGAAATARSVVPLIAAECCPNVLRLFFDRLVPAIRDGRTGSADVALEELLGGEAA